MSNNCMYGIGLCPHGIGGCGCNKASAIKKPSPEGQHELYTGFDPLAPAAIKDRNGEVVLACCKKCGLGESQLDDNPVCRGYKAYPYTKNANRKFEEGQRVTKVKGSNWTGKVVGFYSTELTPIGYCVESETEKGSVQIYPESALMDATHSKRQ